MSYRDHEVDYLGPFSHQSIPIWEASKFKVVWKNFKHQPLKMQASKIYFTGCMHVLCFKSTGNEKCYLIYYKALFQESEKLRQESSGERFYNLSRAVIMSFTLGGGTRNSNNGKEKVIE